MLGGGCKHAGSTNLHQKTFIGKKKIQIFESGGCRLSTGGSLR